MKCKSQEDKGGLLVGICTIGREIQQKLREVFGDHVIDHHETLHHQFPRNLHLVFHAVLTNSTAF